MIKAKTWDYPREVRGRLRTERAMVIIRWALWSPVFGLYKRFPQEVETLYESRRAANAAVASGLYNYKPVKVMLRMDKLLD